MVLLPPLKTTEHTPRVYQPPFLLCLIWVVWFLLPGLGAFFPAQIGQFRCSAVTVAAERCCVVFTPCELNLLLWHRLCISLAYDLCVPVTAMTLCAIRIGRR